MRSSSLEMPHATMIEKVPTVSVCAEALKGLLVKAGDARQKAGFEHAINDTDIKDELDAIFGRDKDTRGELRPTTTELETAFKHVSYGIIARHTMQDPGFSQLWHLLDIANILTDREQADSSLAMILMEELFESQTTEGCRIAFAYLESRQDRMFKKNWRSKQLVTLRICNELLRRFSRADNSVFCGRVFMYLFQIFPLGDRSSVNLRGTYHTENKTTWDHIEAKETVKDELMDVDQTADQPETGKTDGNTAKISVTPAGPVTNGVKEHDQEVLDLDALYPIFWSLQDFFANPKLLFEEANLTLFKAGLEATLAKFHQIQKSHHKRPSSETAATNPPQKAGNKRKWNDNRNETSEELLAFNPKYLTSRDLFDLEVSSLTFRRNVLVQALILLEFLLFQTASGREKQNFPVPDPANPNKMLRPNISTVYSFELPDTEAAWATSKRSEIASYLSHGVEGKFYHRMVDTVLSRDKNWVIWKAHNCLEFVLPSIEPKTFIDAQKSAIRAAMVQRLKASPMGAFDISFLNDPEGQKVRKRLKDPARAASSPSLPILEEKLADVDFDLETATRQAEGADEGEAEGGEDSPLAKKRKLTDLRDSLRWRSLRVGIRKGRLKWFDRLEGEDGKMDALFRNPVIEKEEAKTSNEAKDGDGVEEQNHESNVEDSRDEEMKGQALHMEEDESQTREQEDVDKALDGPAEEPNKDVSEAAASVEDMKGEPIPVFESGADEDHGSEPR